MEENPNGHGIKKGRHLLMYNQKSSFLMSPHLGKYKKHKSLQKEDLFLVQIGNLLLVRTETESSLLIFIILETFI